MIPINTIKTFLLMGIFIQSACSEPRNTSQINVNLNISIDSVMQIAFREGFTGTILIAKDKQLIYQKAFGQDIDTNTAFWIGSLAKPMTALLIMKLIEENKLKLGDSIDKYFSSIPDDKKKITIYNLLTHTSGLPDNYALDGITNKTDAINKLWKQKLKNPVGERNYTVLGYNQLAMLIEEISGKKFEEYAAEIIFNKANMMNTGFWGFEKSDVKLASIDESQNENISETIYKDNHSVENYGYKGGTGIYSTVGDLYSFITALYSNKILNEKKTDMLFKPHFLIWSDSTRNIYQGFDWAIEYNDNMLIEIRKSGAEDWIAHNSMLRFNPGKYTIIVLSNAGIYKGGGKLENVEWSTVVSIWLKDLLISYKCKNNNRVIH
jgi:CubicO group peptidase (beta-lactamase class C family)